MSLSFEEMTLANINVIKKLEDDIVNLKTDVVDLEAKKDKLIKDLNLPGGISVLENQKEDLILQIKDLNYDIEKRVETQKELLVTSYAKQRKNLDAQIEDKKTEVVKYMGEIKNAVEYLSDIQKEIDALLKQKENTMKEIDIEENNLESREIQIEKKDKELNGIKDFLSKKEKELILFESVLGNRDSEIKKWESNFMIRLSDETSKHNALILDYKTQKERWLKDVESKEDILSKKKDDINADILILGVKHKKLDEYNSELVAKSEDLKKVAEEYEIKNNALLSREENLKKLKQEIDYLKLKFEAKR